MTGNWRGDAACTGMAPLFDLDVQLAAWGTEHRGQLANEQRDFVLRTLLNVCDRCPVLEACKNEADLDLNFSTVRAGTVYGTHGQPIHLNLTRRLTASTAPTTTEEIKAA